jgi:hypothetical protein
MHIVGTDLCRRLDIDAEMVINEFAILNKARFRFWWMTLLSYFFLFLRTEYPWWQFCQLLFVHMVFFGVLMSARDISLEYSLPSDCTYDFFVSAVVSSGRCQRFLVARWHMQPFSPNSGESS